MKNRVTTTTSTAPLHAVEHQQQLEDTGKTTTTIKQPFHAGEHQQQKLEENRYHNSNNNSNLFIQESTNNKNWKTQVP